MKFTRAVLFLPIISFINCDLFGGGYSDDPADYPVDQSPPYKATLSPVRWVVPSAGLPPETAPKASNANVDIIFHDGRLYMAWRTNNVHFAAAGAKLQVVSSEDDGQTWKYEHTFSHTGDVREPRFLSYKDQLTLHYFEGGTDPLKFEPKKMYRSVRTGDAAWTAPEGWGKPAEVPWRMKVRDDVAYYTSYAGTSYTGGAGQLKVYFMKSTDGKNWGAVEPGREVVYEGGVSEVAFEFDADGNLWAVTRNEEGDQTGFGSHLCYAPKNALAHWQCPSKSDPERYDSPEMFRYGNELYLIARRDIGGPFDQGLNNLPFEQRKQAYLLKYSTRPKRTALYRIDRQKKKIVFVLDFPSAGDTAFPSIRRTGDNTFLVANYTSPLDNPDISWLAGQLSPKGTAIYLVDLTFSTVP